MSAISIPLTVEPSPALSEAIDELRTLVMRAETAVARIEAFEQRAAEYPNLVIRCDVDPDELRDRIKQLQVDFGYRAPVVDAEQPITDGGKL